MSLLDLASLVLSPTATKEGKVYSAIPDTGEGDMTFTRGSSATRVNSAGLIEKERGNLLLQSNTFDTTWSTSSSTVTGGQSGYDGSSDAWLFTTTVAGAAVQQAFISTGVLTYSVYAKAGSVNGIRLRIDATSDANGYYDLVNGTIYSSEGIDASISNVGNGWYKCSLSQNVSGAVKIQFFTTDGTTSYDNGNIYIQDAMLNQGLVAQSYIETTTSAVYEGITDDVPRVDYSGGGCPSLLLEPQRTNLFEYSEYFEGSYWGKTQQGSASVPVVTGNYAISPEGVQNATRVQFDAVGSTSSDRSGLVRDFAFTSGTTYSISCWVKATSGNNELVQFRVAGSQVGGEQTATDKWQLFTATHTATASVTDNFGMQVRGNNTTNESDILIYGMQLEQNSYVSSYIPTYSISSTRVVDSCSKTGISELIGQSEGTLFWDLETTNKDLYKRLSLNDGTTTNWIFVGIELSTGVCRGYVKDSGVVQVSVTGLTDLTGNRIKLALAYANNDFALYANGSQVATDTSGTIPSCSRIDVGSQNPASAVNSQSTTNQAILFPTRLTNDQLEELTK